MSDFSASRATVTSARFLPLICTGKVMVLSTSNSGSTVGPGFGRDQGFVPKRRPALLGEMRHHRVEQPYQDITSFTQGPPEVAGR